MVVFHKAVDTKISKILKRAYPEFAESDYPLFVTFMEAYYEWMETTGNPYEIISQLTEYRDVDKTTDEFLKYFKKEFMDSIPDNIVANKRNLIKKIKEFYQAKGSEKSYELLFRILYDKSVVLSYPSDDILRCSDGTWLEEQVLRTTSSFASSLLVDLNSRTITGVTSGATAIVENVIRFNIGATVVTEFTVTNIIGVFAENESITVTTLSDVTITETIYPVYTSITLTNAGTGYTVDDNIFIRDGDDTALPAVGSANITKVDATTGAIMFTEIVDFGIEINNPIVDFSSGSGSSATGTLSTSALGTKVGRWINTDGFLSSDKKLQDNFFYQDFSYILQSSIPVDTWRDIVKNVIHPSGMLVFGTLFSEVDFLSTIDVNTSFATLSKWFIDILSTLTLDDTKSLDAFKEILIVLDPTPIYHDTFDEVRIVQRLNFGIQDYELDEIQETISTTVDTPIEDTHVLSARPSSWYERDWESLITTTENGFDVIEEFQRIGTFTRASTGTYVDSAGVMQTAAINEARYGYVPATLAYNGLLIEEARTNIIRYSEDLSSWATAGSHTLTQDVVAPDGSNAYAVEASSDSGGKYLSGSVCTINTDYILSGYVKYVSGVQNCLVGSDTSTFVGGNAIFRFNPITGAYISGGPGVQSYKITDEGNDWWRWEILVTTGAAQVSFAPINYNGSATTGKKAFWGIQAEAGIVVSSYIATTGTSLTRSADLATIPTTPWYNATEGTFVGEFTMPAPNGSGVQAIFRTDDGTFDNAIRIYTGNTSGRIDAFVRSGASYVFQSGLTGLVVGSQVKYAIAYKNNDFAFAINGSIVDTDTTGAVPSGVTQHGIGCNASGGQQLDEHITISTYYTTRKTNAELQTLTT